MILSSILLLPLIAAIPHKRDDIAIKVQNTATGLCLAATLADGMPALLVSCGNPHSPLRVVGSAIKFGLEPSSNMCLDATDGGTRMQAWACFSENDNQQFEMDFGSGEVKWSCGGCVTADGLSVAMRACDGSEAQKWLTTLV